MRAMTLGAGLAAAWLPAACGGLQHYVSDYRTWQIEPYRFLAPPPPAPLLVAGIACERVGDLVWYVDAATRGNALVTDYLRSEGPALEPPCLFAAPGAARPVPGAMDSEIASFIAIEADVAVDGQRRMHVIR